MRVAHIITRMIIGGAQENTLLCSLDLMQDHGDDVLLVTGPSLGPEGDLLSQGRAGDLPVKRIESLRRAIHPWHDLRAYRDLRRALREFQPDVVHTHSAKAGFLGRSAAWTERIPAVVHTVHGAPFHSYQGRAARTVYRLCERYAARRCHALISVADAMTERLVAARVAPPEMFATIYSGMQLEPFLTAREQRDAARRELGYSEQDFVIGKLARLFKLKGHEYVIAAARQVLDQVPQARFLFIGDGVLRANCERQIRRAGLRDYFRFTGLVPPEQIPRHLAALDTLVHASLREGLARCLPQALLAGVPVISFDIDGACEVVVHEQTGLLVPPPDVARLAQAMVRLAGDAASRQRMAEAGRERCRGMFCHHEMTRQIRGVYARVLAGRR